MIFSGCTPGSAGIVDQDIDVTELTQRRRHKSRYRFGRFRLLPHQNRFIQRPCGNLGIIPHHLVAQRGNGFFRVIPLPEQNHRLDAPDFRRKRPITLRLARLPLQPVGALLDLA